MGNLMYLDTTSGQMVAQKKLKLGRPRAMALNPYNAVVHLGHSNGTVGLTFLPFPDFPFFLFPTLIESSVNTGNGFCLTSLCFPLLLSLAFCLVLKEI